MDESRSREDAAPSPVEVAIEVPLPIGDAFGLFADELGSWWPLPYTHSLDRFVDAEIDPRPGERWFERDRDGTQKSWGLVRVFEAPRRLVLDWAVGPRRAPEPDERASTVEIRFEALRDASTLVRVRHARFERHGEDGAKLRDGMASRSGWPLILACYARAAKAEARRRAA